MDLSFLNNDISDIEKKNKLIKLKWQYLNNLRHLEIIIKEYEYKLEKECKHIFITKREISTHEGVKRVLSLPLRHSNIDVLYIPTGVKKNRTRMLKAQSILETMHPDDTDVYALSILDKYENRPD